MGTVKCRCRQCLKMFDAPEAYRGNTVQCSHCNAMMLLPRSPAPQVLAASRPISPAPPVAPPAEKTNVSSSESRTYRWPFVAVVAFICLSAVAIILGVVASKRKYVNTANGFSIRFPKGWTIQENYFKAVVAAENRKDTDDDMMECVSVHVESIPSTCSLQQFVESNRHLQGISIFASGGNSRIISERKVMLGDKQVHRADYTITMPMPVLTKTQELDMKQGDLRGILYLLIDSGRGFTVSCVSSPASFQQYEAVFEETVRSLDTKTTRVRPN